MPILIIVALPFLILSIIWKQNPIKYIKNKIFERYENKYYASEEFLTIRNRVKKYIDNCNKLNEHLSELKKVHIGINQMDYGTAKHYDSSVHNYARPEFEKRSHKEYVYNCSRTICDNANIQPFKYVCKYFNIKPTEENLELFEDLLNNFMDLTKAVEELVQNAELTPEMEQLLAEGNAEQMLTEVEQPLVLNETKQPEVKADNSESDTEQAVTETKETVPVEVVKVSEESAESEAELNESSLSDSAAQAKTKEEPTLGEKFLENLTMSTQTAATGEVALAEEALTSVAQMREIVDQIVEKIKVVIQPEQTNMELQLNPEHLGRVHLTITEKEGMMTAQFAAETHAAKEAIESQLVQLREALQEQGLKVESIEVMVSDFSFNQNSQAGQSTAEGDAQKRRAFVFDTEEEAEQNKSLFTTPDYLAQGTSSVEYSA